MAREKGTGSLQQEKSGRWTVRVGVNGRRLSRSTGTRDRDKAERAKALEEKRRIIRPSGRPGNGPHGRSGSLKRNVPEVPLSGFCARSPSSSPKTVVCLWMTL